MFGPLPESEVGNSYILVAADYFMRWVEAYTIPSQEATTVATKLTDELFCFPTTAASLRSRPAV